MSWREDWKRLRELESPHDGYADRYFNRHLSRPITLLLLRTPITPNQVTLASVLLGVSAGFVVARGGYWPPVLGALLLQLSAVLDDVDGELARLQQKFSRYGEWLDICGDTLTIVAVFTGIAVAVSRQSGPQALYLAGTVLVAGVLVSFVLVTYLERRVFPAAPGGAAHRRLQRYVEILSGRDSTVIVLAFAVAGCLDWFLWAAAAGAQVFWLSLLWLWRAAVRESAP